MYHYIIISIFYCIDFNHFLFFLQLLFAHKVTSDWLEEQMISRDVSSSVSVINGVLYVMMAGILVMLLLYVDS